MAKKLKEKEEKKQEQINTTKEQKQQDTNSSLLLYGFFHGLCPNKPVQRKGPVGMENIRNGEMVRRRRPVDL